MHILAEVMPIYLLGDFLVQPTKQGFEIAGGAFGTLVSWREAGFPFYSDKVAYSQYFNVSGLLKEGENEITVKVTGSLKNTFGFFYQNNDDWIFGPHSWNYAPEKAPAGADYFLMDYGLMEPFELVAVK